MEKLTKFCILIAKFGLMEKLGLSQRLAESLFNSVHCRSTACRRRRRCPRLRATRRPGPPLTRRLCSDRSSPQSWEITRSAAYRLLSLLPSSVRCHNPLRAAKLSAQLAVSWSHPLGALRSAARVPAKRAGADQERKRGAAPHRGSEPVFPKFIDALSEVGNPGKHRQQRPRTASGFAPE